MFSYGCFGLGNNDQLLLVFCAYTLVGIGAAAYSPAKYGIVTEMLPPELLVKGNSWIEGLTVLSIIFGTVLGGVLISPSVSDAVLYHAWLPAFVQTRTERAILITGFVHFLAPGTNLSFHLPTLRLPNHNTH